MATSQRIADDQTGRFDENDPRTKTLVKALGAATKGVRGAGQTVVLMLDGRIWIATSSLMIPPVVEMHLRNSRYAEMNGTLLMSVVTKKVSATSRAKRGRNIAQ